MQVEVNLFGPIREAVGRKTVVVTLDDEKAESSENADDEMSDDGEKADDGEVDGGGTDGTPPTVGDALAALVEAHPSLAGELLAEDGTVPSGVNVTHEGTDVRHLDGAATAVADGDVIRAAPPVVGGSESAV